MHTNRRSFIAHSALAAGAAFLSAPALAAEKAAGRSFVSRKPTMKLGTVTYELARDWDVETIIRNCTEAGFEGVELRTTHKHGVEVSLGREERAAVKKRFADSPVQLMGLGSAFDYHTTDQAKLRRDIDATKEYILLAEAVGATGVKVRPNGFPAGVAQEKTIEQIGRSLREVGEFGEQHGQQIRLEVHGPGTSLLPHIRRMLDVAGHRNVGVCWNSNATDLDGEGFDHNFDLVKGRIFTVHLRDIFLEEYPFRKLFTRLNESGFQGYCLAEIPPSTDPVRVMKYFRALWLAYQGLL